MCYCSENYKGYNCSSLIDYCTIQQPCIAESTCINVLGGYECQCEAYRSGKMCEIVDFFSKLGSTCLNQGTCQNTNPDRQCLSSSYLEWCCM